MSHENIDEGGTSAYIPKSPNLLNGKLALVTGGAGGIGRAITRAMSRAGAQIIAADIDKNIAAPSVGELVSSVAIASSIELNVTDPMSYRAAAE